MNKIIRCLGVVFFGGMLSLFICCSDEEGLGSFIPEVPEFSFDQQVINVSKEGGDFVVNVRSNLPWRAKSDADWISFKSENALADGSFVFSAARNRSINEREAEIIVWITEDTQKTIRVIQAPSELSDLAIHYYVKVDGDAENDGLSWETATTLEAAMNNMVDGDFVHIAAGIYTPVNTLSGGSAGNAGDITFEIHSNVTMTGGYPADAMEGAVSDPANHLTVLSGAGSSGKSFHTVAVSAPMGSGKKVTLQALSIKDGEAAASGTGSVSVNGVPFYRFYGGGLIIGKSTVDIIDCEISNNKSGLHAGGIYIAGGGLVRFERSVIKNNVATTNSSNGGGVFIDASTVYFNECSVISNACTGVGAGIYAFNATSPTYTYVINSTVAYNNNDGNGVNQTRRGGGFYGRENSVSVIVNSTFYGNSGGYGAGISMYGASGKIAKIDVISSTISHNNAFKNGGGIEIANEFAVVNFHNSILSGNTATEGGGDQYGAANWQYSIIGNKVYDANGGEVSGLSFDFSSMLGSLFNNGGLTETCLLQGGALNPATNKGMDTSLLTSLSNDFSPAIAAGAFIRDQTGADRNGTSCIGAVIVK